MVDIEWQQWFSSQSKTLIDGADCHFDDADDGLYDDHSEHLTPSCTLVKKLAKLDFRQGLNVAGSEVESVKAALAIFLLTVSGRGAAFKTNFRSKLGFCPNRLDSLSPNVGIPKKEEQKNVHFAF